MDIFCALVSLRNAIFRFDTTGIRNLIFADQLLQISSRLPSKYIYGLGEHRANLMLDTNWQQFTMFNRDGAPAENVNICVIIYKKAIKNIILI